jgi:hypothetical protein
MMLIPGGLELAQLLAERKELRIGQRLAPDDDDEVIVERLLEARRRSPCRDSTGRFRAPPRRSL